MHATCNACFDCTTVYTDKEAPLQSKKLKTPATRIIIEAIITKTNAYPKLVVGLSVANMTTPRRIRLTEIEIRKIICI